MASDVPAVTNAVRVLERIARDWPDSVASGSLIEDLGLNRSTCYNILGTLQRAGWVASRGDRTGWSLGPRLLSLTGMSTEMVVDVVQQELDDLSQRLGFIAFAVQRHGADEYAVLAKAERGQGIRITVSIGDTFPFSAPAIMRAFHAWSDADEVDRQVKRNGLKAFTSETVTKPAKLRTILKATRERGYGISVREYDLGQSGVAAPVFDSRGRVALVLCSLAFSSELNEENVDHAGTLIRECGLRITARTGGVAPGAD
ncbi:IclR family transcriptional regulator [Streptomyces sp. HNM0575]|uniref:IclR family transcriptional regulator n=1 Tax=Streptomyces sp. HNM0575 TaxID=2716338 RepID=UPI00145F035D|nr:IclR family transcriptional regulator [Streptomyces sp. HNM0575]NLU74996.1 IclR family transcriptional regulator [Streptomyces sp. HNM0575]